MPFEIPKGSLNITTFGPGSPGATASDKKEFIGLRDIPLRRGDVALDPGLAGGYGIRLKDLFKYEGNTYRYVDNYNPRLGRNILDVYYPGSPKSTSSPGTTTDNPFAGGYPQVPQNPQQSPGETTDNPFAGGYPQMPQNIPPSDFAYPNPNDAYRYENTPVSDFSPAPQTSQYFPGLSDSPTFTNPAPSEGGFPVSPDTYRFDPGTNPVPSESGFPNSPSTYLPPDFTNPAPNESMLPGPFSAPENIPPNEEMNPTPNDYYYPAGDGSYITIGPNGQPTGQLPTSDSNPFAGSPTITPDLLNAQNAPAPSNTYYPNQTYFGSLPGGTSDLGSFGGGNLGNFGNVASRGVWGGNNPLTPQNYQNWQSFMNYNNAQGGGLAGMSYNDYLNMWNSLGQGSQGGGEAASQLPMAGQGVPGHGGIK